MAKKTLTLAGSLQCTPLRVRLGSEEVPDARQRTRRVEGWGGVRGVRQRRRQALGDSQSETIPQANAISICNLIPV